MAFRVTMTACVAGNPLKAWRDGTPPDDVWEDQVHDFDVLDDSKAFIAGLPTETTTHVKLFSWDGDEWVEIFEQDTAADHLEAAAPDVPLPTEIDSPLPIIVTEEPVPEPPAVVDEQPDAPDPEAPPDDTTPSPGTPEDPPPDDKEEPAPDEEEAP